MAYNVLVVEDQEMPRQLFEIFIKDDKNFELASSITNADLATAICQSKKIDIILMDVCTAFGSSGLVAAEKIKKEFPKIKIIIVTSMPEFSWLKRAREIGVDSFWYKDVSGQSIIEVMKRTMAGESIYPEETPVLNIGQTTNHDFSDRELEILREMLGGLSNSEIAEELSISPSTVKRHIENMMQKTGFHTRTQLVSEAGRLGIVIK